MQNLQAFYRYFQTTADESVRPLWKYAEYPTKCGTRRELTFTDGSVIIFEMPNDSLECLAVPGKEQNVYRHASYLLSMLADYYLLERPEIRFRLRGSGFQAFMGITSAKVEALNAEGTVERVNRFGQPSEHTVTRINGVRLSRIQENKT